MRTAVGGGARPPGRQQVRLGREHAGEVAAARQPGRLLRLQRRADQARPPPAGLHLQLRRDCSRVAFRGLSGSCGCSAEQITPRRRRLASDLQILGLLVSSYGGEK